MAELEHDLRELIGHTPFEVGAGVIIGIGTAVIWVLSVP
jgi:acid phosphatase family membrane protein YuiD